MDSSQQVAEAQQGQACPPAPQQPNLLYMLSQHLVAHNHGLQLQGQLFPQAAELPALQASTALPQLTTGGMLAACVSMPGMLNSASTDVSATNSPSLAHNNAAAAFSIPPLLGSALHLQQTVAEAPIAAAAGAAAGAPAGCMLVAAGLAGQPADSCLQAATSMLAAGGGVSGSGQHSAPLGEPSPLGHSPCIATPPAAVVTPQETPAESAGYSASHSKAPAASLLSHCSTLDFAAAAAAAEAAERPGFADAGQLQPVPAAAWCTSAGLEAAAAAAATGPAGDDAVAHSSFGTVGAEAGGSVSGATARVLERCPSDLVPVVCGQLHGWYSSSKDQILLLQQYSGAHHQQQLLQPLQSQQPPAAALPFAWVTRPGFVKLAGPRFSQKHSADAAINLLEPDGSKGVTLMALFRRQRRLQEKEQKHRSSAHQHEHQPQQQLLAQLDAEPDAEPSQPPACSSDGFAAAAAEPGGAGLDGSADTAQEAAAGDAAAAAAAQQGAAAAPAAAVQADAAGADAAAAAVEQPAQHTGSPYPAPDSSVQQPQQQAIDLAADVAPVVCGPIKGWYSNSRDKVLLQEQPGVQYQQQEGEALPQGYSAPAAAPESAWLSRKCYMRLAGPQYCKNDSSRAIKMLLPDGSLGTTMATYFKNRQDHLAALRHQAERRIKQQREQEQHQLTQHLEQQQDLQAAAAPTSSGRRSGQLLAVQQYDSNRRSSTPSVAAAGSDYATASGAGSLADTDSACSTPAAEAAHAAATMAAQGANVNPAGPGGVQGTLVPVVCGSVLGWYCSLRDQVLPQQNQLQQLSGDQQQQGAAAAEWVSKTQFMKTAAVQFWKCDSNKAIKLVSPDGTLGSTLGTFIKHERRRMWEQQQQEPGQAPPDGQQQLALPLLQANPEQLLQLQQQQGRGGKQGAADSGDKRRPMRFAQLASAGMQTPTASGVTTTEDDATEDPEYSEGPAAAAAGGGRGLAHASSKSSRQRHAEAVAAAAAAGGLSADECSPQHSPQPQQKAVPVMCGTAFGYYSSSRDEVLMLLKKHQHKGWTQQWALPDPKTLPGSYWMTKLAFKKLGGMQHQHDVLKAIKLLQPDGSLGVTLATFLKHERLQREQQEGMSPMFEGRRRQRRDSNGSGHSTPEHSPAPALAPPSGPPPAKKLCRRKVSNGGATAAKMAAQAAAHRRALAKIAALVAAAEAELTAEPDGAAEAAAAAGESDADGAAVAAAAESADASKPAAGGDGDASPSPAAGTAVSDMSAGTDGSAADHTPAADAAGTAAAVARAASPCGDAAAAVLWLHADADTAYDTADTSEDELCDDMVAVVCGSVRGWYSSSKDLILLRQHGEGEEEPEASDLEESQEQQQQLLAAHVASASESSWYTKQAFKKLGGMQHQHDALKAVKLLQPDGSTGVTLATHLKHSKLQRQRRKQEQREQRRHARQARLVAFMAAVEAAVAAEGLPREVCLAPADAAGAAAAEGAEQAAAAGAAMAAAGGAEVDGAGAAAMEGQEGPGASVAAAGSPAAAAELLVSTHAAAEAQAADGDVAAALAPAAVGGDDSPAVVQEQIRGVVDAAASSAAAGEAFLFAAAAALMQLNITELPAVADAAVDAAAAAADAADATDGTDQEAAGAGGAQGVQAAAVAAEHGLPAPAAAAADAAAAHGDAAGVAAAGGAVGDATAHTGTAVAAGPHTMYAAADAAVAAAAAAAAGDSGNEADDNMDQNPDTDDSRLASSSKKRAAAGAHDCVDDCKRRKLQCHAQPPMADTAPAAAAMRPAGVGAAAAADVPLLKSAVGAVLLQEQAAAHGGRASSGSSYDLGPM